MFYINSELFSSLLFPVFIRKLKQRKQKGLKDIENK